jgi:uncharacterized protein YaeQ
MALKSTTFKADVQLADIGHGCHTSLQLPLAVIPTRGSFGVSSYLCLTL